MVFENGANSQQIEYFRHRLVAWRDQLDSESREGVCLLNKGNTFDWMRQAANAANCNASSQTPQERKQKLIHKIDQTLQKIEAGRFKMRNP